MKKLIFAFSALLLWAASAAAQNDPKAAPEAVVTCGNARFTVLTPRLVRMEWSADGVFEDRATLAIVNRKLEVPSFKSRKSGNGVVLTTDALKLTYKGGKFAADNLKIEFTMSDPSARKGVRTVVWTPGMDDSGNLLGTTRTLDRCDGHKTIEPFDKGVLSRDGWAVVDESKRHLFVEDDSDWKTWVAQRDTTDRLDLYMFAYGHDYKAALGDFIKVAGRIPMPPKYAFGYWWSRYWQYSDFEFVDLGKSFRQMNIPIDIMVVDMDWHETWTLGERKKDEFKQNIGWTGYTWQKQLFPNPEGFLSDVHDLGYKVSLNLHPASGIQPYEDCYETFREDYLSRTDDYDGPKDYVWGEEGHAYKGFDKSTGKPGTFAPVPFRICQREWADAYFNSVIHPFEAQGVDFWWLDWQQWRRSKYTSELSNTFWLNRTFFDDKVRRTESMGKDAPRPFIYHRWGGLGSHRYQIGFSGDTYTTWDVLSYLPYFTSTASNVGYGYWGHDIGGHMFPKGVNQTDSEMLTRWLQYGIFTPIFKTHSTKNAEMERKIWMYPEYFTQMKEAIRLRYSLSPYIYTAARQTYDTGVSMCRPMYYDYPEEERAYTWKEQHLFGDDMLVAAFNAGMDRETGLAKRSWWLPSGCRWYDAAHGILFEGGQEIELDYTIDEIPLFIKAGAVIPMASEKIQSLQEDSDELYLYVAPGEESATASVYEDDGKTQAYHEDYAVTTIQKTVKDGVLTLRVAAREGSYKGALQTRRLRVVLDDVLPPTEVRVNGKTVPYARRASEGEWTYDGSRLAAVVLLPQMSVDEEVVVECVCTGSRELLDGKKAVVRRAAAITPETKLVFCKNVDKMMMLPTNFLKVAQCGSLLTEQPLKAAEHLSAIDLEALYNEMDAFEKLPAEFRHKIKAQLR